MVVGVCDDEKHVRNLIESYVRTIDPDTVIYHFENGQEILMYLRQGKKIDVLFLDIDFKGEPDGMLVANRIKSKQIAEGSASSALPLIIFVTGLPDRMPEAFGVRAFQFLEKPVDMRQFAHVYEQAKKAVLYAPRLNRNRCITVYSSGKSKTIPLNEICCIESRGRKLIIYTENNSIETYGTLASVKEDLDESFFMVHRSFVVDMGSITDYNRSTISLTNGESVPMSKYKYKEFVEKYAEFLESDI